MYGPEGFNYICYRSWCLASYLLTAQNRQRRKLLERLLCASLPVACAVLLGAPAAGVRAIPVERRSCLARRETGAANGTAPPPPTGGGRERSRSHPDARACSLMCAGGGGGGGGCGLGDHGRSWGVRDGRTRHGPGGDSTERRMRIIAPCRLFRLTFC